MPTSSELHDRVAPAAVKVLSVVGTRPEAIKMAPVINELARAGAAVESRVCSMGQHREMLWQALEVFGIVPDYELDVMQPDQTLAALTASLMGSLDQVVQEFRPNWVLAQGDTTSVLASGLVAFYRHVQFGHVEAGLRTADLQRPFPEELNRRVADLVASAWFAPTERAREALLREQCDPDRIHVTGNTIVDALHDVASRPYDWSSGPLKCVRPDRPTVLITAHRRESFGDPFRQICQAIRDLAASAIGRSVQFVYPVHLNPNVRRPVFEILSGLDNVILMEPLDYVSLVHLMRRSVLVLTDSGGIQEEAPSFRVPVLVMRDTTERPEGLATGLVRLVGVDRGRIVREAEAVLRAEMPRTTGEMAASPYGDGRAAPRIVSVILQRDEAARAPAALGASSHV